MMMVMMVMMTRHMPEQDHPTTAKDFGRDPIPMGVFINQVSVRALYLMNFKSVLTLAFPILRRLVL